MTTLEKSGWPIGGRVRYRSEESESYWGEEYVIIGYEGEYSDKFPDWRKDVHEFIPVKREDGEIDGITLEVLEFVHPVLECPECNQVKVFQENDYICSDCRLTRDS